jgi:hypothetical protein
VRASRTVLREARVKSPGLLPTYCRDRASFLATAEEEQLLAEIKSYVKPRKLYRYRSLDKLERELEAIEEGYLYCSPYSKLNDPMEGVFSSSEILRNSANYRTVRNAIRNKKSQIGICSFSETHDHELMWAHYANQFSGVCIAYSLSRLLTNLQTNVSLVRMYYDEHGPTVYRTNKTPIELAKMVLSYKSYRWLYEREWRMFAEQGKVAYGSTNCVTHVYFGSRINTKKRARFENALDALNISSSSMSISKYLIKFED